jgi:hypothetical protein
MTQATVFDRLRKLETEGRPLHALIVDACDVGNEVVGALDQLLHALHPSTQRIAAQRARTALARAYNGNGDTPDNGKAAA